MEDTQYHQDRVMASLSAYVRIETRPPGSQPNGGPINALDMDEYAFKEHDDWTAQAKFERIPAPCTDDICPLHTTTIAPPNYDPGRTRLEQVVAKKFDNVPAQTEPQLFLCPLNNCLRTICSAPCLTWQEFGLEIIDHLSFHEFKDHNDEATMLEYLKRPLTAQPSPRRPMAIRKASMGTRRKLAIGSVRAKDRRVLNLPLYWALKAGPVEALLSTTIVADTTTSTKSTKTSQPRGTKRR